MNDKYKNKYRIASARLTSWNYGWQALYFVTICTAGRTHFFGDIINGQMMLSDLGRVAEDEWVRTPTIRPDMNLELDAFCIMPNHMHAIIAIGDNQYNTNGAAGRGAMHHGSTGGTNRYGSQSKNLASIVRGYKSTVTTHARIKGLQFGWQSRYYEHIIRHDAQFERIQQYIVNNHLTWQEDTLHE